MFSLKNFAKRLAAAVVGLGAAVIAFVSAIPSIIPVLGAPFGYLSDKAALLAKTCSQYARDADGVNPIIGKTAPPTDSAPDDLNDTYSPGG